MINKITNLFNFKSSISSKGLIIWLSLFLFYSLSTISNYKLEITIIKSILSIIISIILLIIVKKNNVNIRFPLSLNDYIILIFILYLAITITFSPNTEFGFLKLYNFLLVIYPVFILRLIFFDKLLQSALIDTIKIFILSSTLLSIYIVMTKPFIFFNTGEYTRQFSHVFSGRFIALSILVASILLVKGYLVKLYYAVIIINTIALGVTSFRAGIAALIISMIIFLIVNLNNRQKSLKISSLLILQIILLLLSGLYQNIFIRLNWIKEFVDLGKIADGTITSRLDAYRLALQMWKESPVCGIGFGGFNSLFNGNVFGMMIKYPHNIFIEVLTETGIIGLCLAMTLFINYTIKIYKNSKESVLVFVYLLILSLFSKDLASNGIIFALGILFSGTSSAVENDIMKSSQKVG